MFVPFKAKSILRCLTTEPISSGAVSRNRNLEDNHNRSINFAGTSGEGCLYSQLKSKVKFVTLVSRLWL